VALPAVAAVDSRGCPPFHFSRGEALFFACSCCPLAARTIYRLGSLWRSARTIASDSSLAAHCFPDLGNSHRTAPLALPFNTA